MAIDSLKKYYFNGEISNLDNTNIFFKKRKKIDELIFLFFNKKPISSKTPNIFKFNDKKIYFKLIDPLKDTDKNKNINYMRVSRTILDNANNIDYIVGVYYTGQNLILSIVDSKFLLNSNRNSLTIKFKLKNIIRATFNPYVITKNFDSLYKNKQFVLTNEVAFEKIINNTKKFRGTLSHYEEKLHLLINDLNNFHGGLVTQWKNKMLTFLTKYDLIYFIKNFVQDLNSNSESFDIERKDIFLKWYKEKLAKLDFDKLIKVDQLNLKQEYSKLFIYSSILDMDGSKSFKFSKIYSRKSKNENFDVCVIKNNNLEACTNNRSRNKGNTLFLFKEEKYGNIRYLGDEKTYLKNILIEDIFNFAFENKLNIKEENLYFLSKTKINQKLYDEIFQNANHKCQYCGSKTFKKFNGENYLEIHYINSLTQGGKIEKENMVALCSNCHSKAHFSNESLEIKKFLKNGDRVDNSKITKNNSIPFFKYENNKVQIRKIKTPPQNFQQTPFVEKDIDKIEVKKPEKKVEQKPIVVKKPKSIEPNKRPPSLNNSPQNSSPINQKQVKNIENKEPIKKSGLFGFRKSKKNININNQKNPRAINTNNKLQTTPKNSIKQASNVRPTPKTLNNNSSQTNIQKPNISTTNKNINNDLRQGEKKLNLNNKKNIPNNSPVNSKNFSDTTAFDEFMRNDDNTNNNDFF